MNAKRLNMTSDSKATPKSASSRESDLREVAGSRRILKVGKLPASTVAGLEKSDMAERHRQLDVLMVE
jgi:hypothetical protein